MKLYHPISIENLNIIQTKVLELFPKGKLHTNSLFYLPNNLELMFNIPELKAEFDKLGWTNYVQGFALYVRQRTRTKIEGIHIDTGASLYSFNIPIMGCEGTFTQFYSSLTPPEYKYYLEYGKVIDYYSVNPNTCTLRDSFEMTMPHVIKVKEIHNIYNPNTTPRITLLSRLSNDLNLDHLFN